MRSLAELAQKIQQKHRTDSQLPPTLGSFSEKEKQNPLTHKPLAEDAWRHAKGDFCFPLDATQSIPQAPYYY